MNFIAFIWYTGHGERGTGNWCFEDGVISFEDIFALYMKYFRGRQLNLTCDCSYSGNWVERCAKKLDEIGVLSCGHHTREHGILIRIYCSCRENQQATMLQFCEEVVFVRQEMLWYDRCKISSGQTPLLQDFTKIRCGSKAECKVPPDHIWMDHVINNHYVHLVTYKVEGKPAWFYILVDREKVENFRASIDVDDYAKYGKIILTGWGNNPPKEINDRFKQFLG